MWISGYVARSRHGSNTTAVWPWQNLEVQASAKMSSWATKWIPWWGILADLLRDVHWGFLAELLPTALFKARHLRHCLSSPWAQAGKKQGDVLRGLIFGITVYIDYHRGNYIVQLQEMPQMTNKQVIQLYYSLKLIERDCRLSLKLNRLIGSWPEMSSKK